MDKKELEKLNRSKYGEKSNDLISRTYKQNLAFGDVWCCKSAERYLDRFSRIGSSKGLNKTDLIKASDYISRAIEQGISPEAKINELFEAQVKDLTKGIKFKDKKEKVLEIANVAIYCLNLYLSDARNPQFLLKAKAIVEEMYRFVDKRKQKEIIE